MVRLDGDADGRWAAAYGPDPSWRERDFVREVRSYLDGGLARVLVVSGLRGTGRTVGVLQALAGRDFLYLRSEEGEPETADDYLAVLKGTGDRPVAIDEYPRIRGRGAILDAYLYTMAEDGRRVVVTGDDSFMLVALTAGALIHRARVIDANHSTFGEFRRVAGPALPRDPHEARGLYLRRGGNFEDLAGDGLRGLDAYVRGAIAGNLAALHSLFGPSGEELAAAVYAALYGAVGDTVCRGERGPARAYREGALGWLRREGLLGREARPGLAHIENTAADLASIGVLARVPRDPLGGVARSYVVCPALAWALVSAYEGEGAARARLGSLSEASEAVAEWFGSEGAN